MIRRGWVSDVSKKKFVSLTIKGYLLVIIEIQCLEDFLDLRVSLFWIPFLHNCLELIKANGIYIGQESLAWCCHDSVFLWWDRILLLSVS